MFGLDHLAKLLKTCSYEVSLTDTLLNELTTFTGIDREQEDDVTLVLLQRTPILTPSPERDNLDDWCLLMEQAIASIPGNELLAMRQVIEAMSVLDLPTEQSANLATAVAEAVMNAMEHGNQYLPDRCVLLQVRFSQTSVAICVSDEGHQTFMHDVPASHDIEPDLDAKLLGLQSPRGWGLFLMKNLVDEMYITQDGRRHTIELIIRRSPALTVP
jgi:anti-sigma regulatory factor (Ser/Thr protein kinase)